MTDQLDRAEEEIEAELAEALRQRKPGGPVASGYCHYCFEPVAEQLRWCDGTECEREWEYVQARRAMNGRIG